MPLTLRIENVANLPDGGPLSFVMRGQTRADIGRDTFLDWSLPDPERYISGKHCEIQRQGDEYHLVDVSTNGTYVNGSATRVQSPYRLKDGDRLQIGEYLIGVTISGGEDASPPAPEPAVSASIDRPASYDSLWDVDGDVAPPADPKDFWPKTKPSPVYGEFLYRAADVPNVSDVAQFAPAADDTFDWAPPASRTPSAPSSPRKPEPRRPAVPPDWNSDPPHLPAEPAAPAAFAPTPAVSKPSFTAPPPKADVPPASDAFVRAFADATGIPIETLRQRSSEDLGTLLGQLLLIVTGEMQQLLQARVHAKRLARSSEHTTIQPQENNPLKFSPTPEDALRIMLGPPTRSYLDAHKAIQRGFDDLKRHQVQTYSAMQKAIGDVMAGFDPAAIEKTVPPQPAIATLLKSRKAQLWDAYLALWQAQSSHADGVIGRFMLSFGNHYDRAGESS